MEKEKVFLCKLIGEKDFLETEHCLIVIAREEGRGKRDRERSERERQSGRQKQRRKNLCKMLIVMSG